MVSARTISARSRILATILAALVIVLQILLAAPAAAAAHPLRFGVTTPSGPLSSQEISAVARTTGERPQMEMWYSDFRLAAPVAALNAVRQRGAEPVITWEPWSWGGGLTQPAYSLDRIRAGDFDGYLRNWATALRDWGHPVTIRLAHEMNGNWYPWAEGVNGNDPGDYVAAWRHVHDVFTSVGALQVGWMWSPNIPYPGSVPLIGLYPGDAYVDVVALDGYNWGASRSWSTWTNPNALFGPGLEQMRTLAPGKPIVIAETASAEAGGNKAVWITALISYLDSQAGVTGFIWFQQNKEVDWRFTSSSAAAAAFASALANRR